MVVIALTMGTSAAMKAIWVEDALSLVPSIAFLVGAHYRNKKPDERFPYGYRRAVLIGFLAGAVTLFGFGVYLFGDAVVKLLTAERPSIPSATIFGKRVWMGWVMIVALVYSVIPPFVLGRMKQPLARNCTTRRSRPPRCSTKATGSPAWPACSELSGSHLATGGPIPRRPRSSRLRS